MWLIVRSLFAALVLAASGDAAFPAGVRVSDPRPYRLEVCDYCQTPTWCEIRQNGRPQCRACKVERFFERMLYPPLGYKLQLWQRKALRDLYGTVRESDGLRQYRKAYLSTGKQNGKSFILGGLPIYHLLCENEFQPEAYGVASAKDQAGIVFKAAALLVKMNPALMEYLKVTERSLRLYRKDGGGSYQVLSADGDVQDGKRPSLLIFDELHRFTKKKAETVRTVLVKGMASRAPVVNGIETGEPLMVQTTTSGDELESPMWAQEYEHAQQVISGERKDPGYYALIYQADPKRIASDPEYWKSREARAAGNPSHQDHGGFLSDRELEAQMLEAVARPEKRNDYIRLNLNVPCAETDTPAVDMATWYANGGEDDLRKWPEYDEEYLIRKWELKGRRCYAGVDLAWTTDMTGMVLVFPPERANEKWKLLWNVWLPEDRLHEIERITGRPLQQWKEKKFLSTVPGVKMKLSAVEDKLRWAAETFNLAEMCFDPWGNMVRSAEVLASEGMACIEVKQTIPELTAPTKEFLAMYLNRDFEHGNHPIANWHMSCLSLDRDHNDNVKPKKPDRDISKKRIDLIAALINGLKRATVPYKDRVDDLILL